MIVVIGLPCKWSRSPLMVPPVITAFHVPCSVVPRLTKPTQTTTRPDQNISHISHMAIIGVGGLLTQGNRYRYRISMFSPLQVRWMLESLLNIFDKNRLQQSPDNVTIICRIFEDSSDTFNKDLKTIFFLEKLQQLRREFLEKIHWASSAFAI